MGEFIGATSIAEAMGSLYGDKIRLITAIAGTIGSAGLIAVQFKVFGNVVSYFIGITPTIAIIIFWYNSDYILCPWWNSCSYIYRYFFKDLLLE